MKKVTRSSEDNIELTFVLQTASFDGGMPVVFYKTNKTDEWIEIGALYVGSDSCGYVVTITFFTTDIPAGSLFVKLQVGEAYYVMEEYILEDYVEETLSIHEGVKIIE